MRHKISSLIIMTTLFSIGFAAPKIGHATNTASDDNHAARPLIGNGANGYTNENSGTGESGGNAGILARNGGQGGAGYTNENGSTGGNGGSGGLLVGNGGQGGAGSASVPDK